MSKIIVLCKYNQARSITAAAALRRFFPEEEILSAGILGNPLIPIPSSIIQILDQWGLYERDECSRSINDLPDISPSDLILCADQEVRSVFEQQLKIESSDFPNICILEDFARRPLEIPIDPVGLDEAETKNQLARSLVLAIRGTNKFLENIPVVSKGYLPTNRDEHLDLQKRFLESNSERKLFIDVGFSIPDTNIWSPRIDLRKINPNKLEKVTRETSEHNVLISKFEVDKTAELFLSVEYHEWLKMLSSTLDLVVIAQPFESLPKNRRHEAILGMIHS